MITNRPLNMCNYTRHCNESIVDTKKQIKKKEPIRSLIKELTTKNGCLTFFNNTFRSAMIYLAYNKIFTSKTVVNLINTLRNNFLGKKIALEFFQTKTSVMSLDGLSSTLNIR